VALSRILSPEIMVGDSSLEVLSFAVRQEKASAGNSWCRTATTVTLLTGIPSL
jgi:hypothetical protein